MEKKESFLSKFLLATVPAIVIAYVTNNINKKQSAGEKQEIRHELAVQLAKSLELSNEKLNHWIEKYEILSNKYDKLRQRAEAGGEEKRPRRVEAAPSASAVPGEEAAPAAVVAGTWTTPDGTVIWSFEDGRVRVNSSNLLPGMVSGMGSYRQEGDAIRGAIDLDRAFYLPVNQRMQFNGQVLNNGRTITGTTTDPQGVVSAISLHR